MAKFLDLTGLRFGRLVVKGLHPKKIYNSCTAWDCACDCGAEIVTITGNLRSENTASCGCHKNEASRARLRRIATKHGLSKHPLYPVWKRMIARCHAPKDKDYPMYGARGIRVCDRWRGDFMAFVADMGPKPTPKHSLDRRDNYRGYEPGNMRWATAREQEANKRKSRLFELNGRQQTLGQWAAEYRMSADLLWQRVNRDGMTLEEALTRVAHAPAR